MSSPQPVTEMAFLPFPPNTPLHDPSTPAGAVWARVLHDVSLAPGYCSQHWGYNLSSPGQVWYLVDWVSIDAHTSYETTPACASINEALFPLFAPSPPAPAPHMFHVRFPPGSGKVWDEEEEEAVKVFFFYMDTDENMSAAQKAEMAAALERLRLLEDRMAGGWALEAGPWRSEDDRREQRLFVLAQPGNSKGVATNSDDDVSMSNAVCEAFKDLSLHSQESTLEMKG